MEDIEGGGTVYVKPLGLVTDVPLATIVTATEPGEPRAGVTALMVVPLLDTLTPVAGEPPTVTEVTFEKFKPEMVIAVV